VELRDNSPSTHISSLQILGREQVTSSLEHLLLRVTVMSET